ncbi:MAG: hypothetical protein KDA66_07645 [Planctomycetaceae bacterium]|nr:hypothetical protein [Planctomycetaceae bacterium]
MMQRLNVGNSLFGRLMLGLLLGASTFVVGCSTAQTSNTARSSTEQLLVSNAIDQSLNKIDFSTVAGYSVYLNDAYVDCVDKNYVIGAVRHRILNSGGRLVANADEADIVLELRSGGVGTSMSESYVGIPEITLPGMLALPEVRLLERKSQHGIAKLGLVAYDPKTNQILGSGGTSLAQSDDSNWYVVGIGPYQNGSIRNEIESSTTGFAAQVRNRLPNQVVFDQPERPAGLVVDPPAPEAKVSTEPVTPAWYQEK